MVVRRQTDGLDYWMLHYSTCYDTHTGARSSNLARGRNFRICHLANEIELQYTILSIIIQYRYIGEDLNRTVLLY